MDATRYPTSGTLQELIELLTVEISKMSEAEKAEFRRPWLKYVEMKERIRESDTRFLRSVGVDPDGDD